MSAIDIDGGVAATTLAGDLTSGSTTIVLEDGSTYPPGGVNFYIVINRGQSHEEVVEISSRSGDALIVAGGVSGRGADNTSATAHSRGDTVEHCVPALALQDMNTHVSQTTGAPHGDAYLTPSGTAAAATALETARQISLTGDATGAASFDGTANATISTTVAAAATARGVSTFADAAARDAAITSPSAGMLAFLQDTNQLFSYNGSAWNAVVKQQTVTFTSSGTFTKASYPWATYAVITCVGPGGAGGGVLHSELQGEGSAGSGGGSGSTSIKFTATSALAASETVTVGTGGTVGTVGAVCTVGTFGIRSVRLARSALSVQSVRPVRSARSFRSVRSVRSALSARSVRSVWSVRSALSARSVWSVRSVRSARSVRSVWWIRSVWSARS